MTHTRVGHGERTSFIGLFREGGYRVEIPMIQRDYAQGRVSERALRKRFLEALKGYLEDDVLVHDLDFVYGAVEGQSLTVLDGQQRLTTLFLLHWYLAQASGRSEEFRGVLLDEDRHSRFSYRTRTSSRDFCDQLVQWHPTQDEVLVRVKAMALSDVIKDQSWYSMSWDHDPTVSSMLVVLDEIDLLFQSRPDFFDLLVRAENPAITFLFLELKDFGLTDDLYIRMNSRGRELTGFENFKAQVEKHLAGLEAASERKARELNGQVVTQEGYFLHKMDREWSDFFWKLIPEDEPFPAIDDSIMNWIRTVLSGAYAERSKRQADANLEQLLDTEVAKKEDGYVPTLSFFDYQGMGLFKTSDMDALIDAFDVLQTKRLSALPGSFIGYFNEHEIIQRAFTHKLSHPDRVLIFGYLRWLTRGPVEGDSLGQWLRVLNNLVQNAAIDGAEEFRQAVQAVAKIIDSTSNILEWLTSAQGAVEFFYGRQVEEERIKAWLVLRSPRWKAAIEPIEVQTCFKGQLGFLLEFAGILSYFKDHGDCAWTELEDDVYFTSFQNYATRALSVWAQPKDSDYRWERAVLTKGAYLVEASSNRRNFLSSDWNVRDYSWKRLLRLPPVAKNGSESEGWSTRRKLVKMVFDDHRFDPADPFGSLEKILGDEADDWRRAVIHNPALIALCKYGFIRYENDHDILLYQSKQQNGWHAELYTYAFFCDHLMDQEALFAPFAKIAYQFSKVTLDRPHIVMKDARLGSSSFDLEIRWRAEAAAFLLRLVHGDSLPVPADLQSAFEAQGFHVGQNGQAGLELSVTSAKEAKAVLELLCSDLLASLNPNRS